MSRHLSSSFSAPGDAYGLVGVSEAIEGVRQAIGFAAPTDATVLIGGETGTGKELVSRAIHQISPRRQGPFVRTNCASLPEGLIESELFGHEKGAFTGASNRRAGWFERAHNGTLLLDEIGDLPPLAQAKMLRVLQEGEFERLGAAASIVVDTRVIGTTNVDLQEAVREGRFRKDLFFRLNVFPIWVPPLRERREDIELLAEHFLAQLTVKYQRPTKSISAGVIDELTAYDWPGNVRQLQNLIERAVILSQGPELSLPEVWRLKDPPVADGQDGGWQAHATLEDVERHHIERILAACDWRVSGPGGAAERLGLNRTTLQARMRKLGIGRGPAQPKLATARKFGVVPHSS